MEEDTLQKIKSFCLDKPESVICGIVSCLRAHLASEVNLEQIIHTCGLNTDTTCLLQELTREIPHAEQLATALETGLYISKSSKHQSSFVFSGPTQILKDTRNTEQVLLDIINRATRNIILVSFAAYKVQNLVDALQDAIRRRVCTRFILETVEDSAGQLSFEAKSAFDSLPGARFYHWPLNKRQVNASGKPGKMHAKCAINDDSFFITSANLTNDAAINNIELGIYEQDKSKTLKLMSYFENLISNKILVEY